MKTVALHLSYIAVGVAIFAFLMGLHWTFNILWALYIEHYFVAVNRTIAVIIVAGICWFFGRVIVTDYIKTRE